MRRWGLFLLAGLSALAPLGCARMRDRLLHPGPSQFQRQRAEKKDPYNHIPIGPRDDTGRPPDYQFPNPEAADGRWDDWGWPRFGHDPPEVTTAPVR